MQQRLNYTEADTSKWAGIIEKSNIQIMRFWTSQWMDDGK